MSRTRVIASALALAAMGSFPVPCLSQGADLKPLEPDSLLVSLFRVDFAVPDAPAFELVDVKSDNILRPATVRQFAVAASNFAGADGGFQVPEAFAVELAPFLLARGPRLSIADYQRSPWLYRFRVSGATGRDSLERMVGAVGVRVTLIDEADLRTDSVYLQGVVEHTSGIVALLSAERDARVAAGKPVDPNDPIDDLSDLTGERRQTADSLIAARAALLRRMREEEAWNARVLDVALGSRVGSEDSLGRGLAVTDYVGWVTYGHGFGAWGQLLLGLRGSYGRDEVAGDFVGTGSLGARLYVGSNRYKGFAEALVTVADREEANSFLLNAGAEARVVDALWATFSAGLDWTGGEAQEPRLVSRFALKVPIADIAK